MFQNLEKANCHLHLTGALTKNDIQNLHKQCKISFKHNNLPERSYTNFRRDPYWNLLKNIISTEAGLYNAIMLVAKNESEDTVKYLEITLNPFGIINRNMSPESIAHILSQASKAAKIKYDINIKFKLGINRKDGLSSIEPVKNIFIACDENIIVCIDLNGNERKYPTIEFIESFNKLNELGIATSIHVGEYLGTEQSLKEVVSISPKRIAHGIAGCVDKSIFEAIAHKNILVEVSPTSNLLLNTAPGIQPHPIRTMCDLGVKIILGNDDPAFFGNPISGEMDMLLQTNTLNQEEILRINNRGLQLQR
jgi:adenosine deaminase